MKESSSNKQDNQQLKQREVNNKTNNKSKNREFARFHTKSGFYRSLIIDIKKQLASKSVNSSRYIDSVEHQVIKIDQGYKKQSMVQSQYVLRNRGRKQQPGRVIWFQQDFDRSYLQDFQLQNLTFCQRINIIWCIANGVKNIHEQLICHRSLSASSICIIKLDKGKIKAKITNFLNASILENPKSYCEQMCQDTNYFSSPQLITGKNHSLPTDIWSLGCLFSYILYDTIDNIWQKDQQIYIEVPDGTPDWLIRLFRSMLDYSPAKRPNIKQVLQILKCMTKCMDVLEKSMEFGKKLIKFNKIPSKLSSQKL